MMLTLRLSRLPDDPWRRRGIYGDEKNLLPPRFMYLHPEAARALLAFENDYAGILYLSDVLRSAAASFKKSSASKGAKPPGWSGHNYGLSIDVALKRTLKLSGWTFAMLCQKLADYGWHCHVRNLDGSRREAWHFNYLGDQADYYLQHTHIGKPATWDNAVEHRIMDFYGTEFERNGIHTQWRLASLDLYEGPIDGERGAATMRSIMSFQDRWGLLPDGVDGPKTRRVLALVTSRMELVPL